MSGTIWSKFYWSDWESDPALRLCSLAAQGLWMRMLCIASAHDPIGYVAVAGRGLDETALARMTGCSGSEAADLLGELDRNGVFSRDRNGRIFSRRMVNDAKRAAIARKNGKKGGNPSLSNSGEKQPWDNPPDNPPLKTQEPTTSNQTIEEAKASLSPTPTKAAYPEEFEAAWKLYPHHTRRSSKPDSLRQWRKLSVAERLSLPAACARYRRLGAEPKGECGAPAMERWLKRGLHLNWTDDGEPVAAEGPADTAVVARRLRHYRDTGAWEPTWGEKPRQAA